MQLQKEQEEEQTKADKIQAVAAKFQEYYDLGLKAMEEGRLNEAMHAFYQAQGLRPDSIEAKSKLIYCKNLMKATSGKTKQAA